MINRNWKNKVTESIEEKREECFQKAAHTASHGDLWSTESKMFDVSLRILEEQFPEEYQESEANGFECAHGVTSLFSVFSGPH